MEYRSLEDWITLYDSSIEKLKESFLLFILNNYNHLDKDSKMNYKEFKKIFTEYCKFINDELLERWS